MVAGSTCSQQQLWSPASQGLAAVTVVRMLQYRDTWFLQNLVDHLEEIQGTEDWHSFLAVVTFLRESCGAKHLGREEILHCLGILSSNAFNISSNRARALFPTLALFNHSCSPNARHIVSSEERAVEVLAQRDIKKGEEISIRYTWTTQVLEPLAERRAFISSQWHFSCCCSRCSDTSAAGCLAALVCQLCQGSLVSLHPLASDSQWGCDKCAATITATEAQLRVDKVATTLGKIGKSDVRRLESFLGAAARILHPCHSLVLEVKRSLFSLYGGSQGLSQGELSQDQVTRKLLLGQEYISAVTKVDPGITRWRAQMLYEMNRFKLVSSLQSLQSRAVGVEGFLELVTVSVGELEEAVAGLTGERIGGKCRKLKSRLEGLSKAEVLGPGYSHIINIVLKLPFLS